MKKSEIKLTKDQAEKILDKRLSAVFELVNIDDKKAIARSLINLLVMYDGNIIVDFKETE